MVFYVGFHLDWTKTCPQTPDNRQPDCHQHGLSLHAQQDLVSWCALVLCVDVLMCAWVWVCMCMFILCLLFLVCSDCLRQSPWYNHNGWLDAKHQVTYSLRHTSFIVFVAHNSPSHLSLLCMCVCTYLYFSLFGVHVWKSASFSPTSVLWTCIICIYILVWRVFFIYQLWYIYMYIYVCVCACVCMCMCACVCACVYTYKNTKYGEGHVQNFCCKYVFPIPQFGLQHYHLCLIPAWIIHLENQVYI